VGGEPMGSNMAPVLSPRALLVSTTTSRTMFVATTQRL
jgi:hypothetical protein